MTGALFIYPMFRAIIAGNKTQTSRFTSARQGLTKHILSGSSDRPQWHPGQLLYIKEPVYLWGVIGAQPDEKEVVWQQQDAKFTNVAYQWDGEAPPEDRSIFWIEKKKLFCPERAARYKIQVMEVGRKRLGDFTADDYQRQGLKRNISWAMPTLSQTSVNPAEKPKIEWSLELANDLVKTDPDPLQVWQYLLKLTDRKFVYDPETWVWTYQFKLV